MQQHGRIPRMFSSTPVRFALFMAAAVIVCDVVTMTAVSAVLPGVPPAVRIGLDGLVLALTILPLFRRFIVKPLEQAAQKERDRAEEVNRQSASDWEDTFNTITDMITIHDSDFNIIRANRAARQRLGLAEDMAGKAKCFKLFHGSDCPPKDCPSCRSIATKKELTGESYEPHLGIYLETRAIPRLDAENRLIGLVHVVRDITGRKRMEEAIEAQRRFAEKVIQNSAVATFVLDPAHRVVVWNKACEGLTGLAAGSMIGTDDQWRPFYDHKRPVLADVVIDGAFDRLPSLYGKYSRSTFVADGIHAEGWYLNLNGKNRYMIFDAAPIYGSDGKLLVVIETLQEVPERKRIEEELARSESKLRTLIEAEHDCVLMLAPDGTLLEMNRAGRQMVDADFPEQVEGRSIYPLILPGYVQQLQKLVLKIFQGGTGTIEFEFSGLKGTRRWVETRAVPLRNPEGSVIALLGVARDITEHKKLEGQLRHAQKLEAVGTLTGGIAHDFNNILTSIIGYGGLLELTRRDDVNWQAYLEQLLSSARRAAHLTQNLLAFSRKQIINSRAIDVNGVIRRVEGLLQRLIGENIEIRTSMFTEALIVQADENQLDQVLMNLALNARDAMPYGGTLTIATDVAVGEDGLRTGWARITVTDSGTGMDESTRERIFEPFYTTKQVGRGTGLGLSIVYGIIKQHNGSIECESRPGEGTTFAIQLPLVPGRAEEARQMPRPAIQRGTETILVAEDDASVRRLTRTMLEGLGYRVLTAPDGDQALALFKENADAIDLLLFDVIMPKQDGMQIYDAIRKLRPEIKVLFTSGYTADVISSSGYLEQGMHFIPKPASLQDLSKKVRQVLDD